MLYVVGGRGYVRKGRRTRVEPEYVEGYESGVPHPLKGLHGRVIKLSLRGIIALLGLLLVLVLSARVFRR